MALRAGVVVGTIVLAIGLGTLLTRLRTPDLGVGPPTVRTTSSVSSPGSSPTPTATSGPATVMFCGAATRYAADGAHMLLTLTSGAARQQFNLQYQFAKILPPTDIGDRLARGETQLLRVEGRQVEPDSGSPSALTLRDYVVGRVNSCP
jgi:hypothetical protein